MALFLVLHLTLFVGFSALLQWWKPLGNLENCQLQNWSGRFHSFSHKTWSLLLDELMAKTQKKVIFMGSWWFWIQSFTVGLNFAFLRPINMKCAQEQRLIDNFHWVWLTFLLESNNESTAWASRNNSNQCEGAKNSNGRIPYSSFHYATPRMAWLACHSHGKGGLFIRLIWVNRRVEESLEHFNETFDVCRNCTRIYEGHHRPCL